MWRESRQLPKTLCAASALALVLGAGMVGDYVDFDTGIVPSAYAAQQAGGRGEKGGGPGDLRGGMQQKGRSESGRGAKSVKDVLADDGGDDDSDRPGWVNDWKGSGGEPGSKKGGPPTTHRPGEKPRVPGIKMGDVYGDLWVILRQDDGTPIYVKWDWVDDGDEIVEAGEVSFVGFCTTDCDPADGWVIQPLATDGTVDYTYVSGAVPGAVGLADLVPLDEEGAPLVVYAQDNESVVLKDYSTYTQEIDIGRSNVARSPSKVITHALEEAWTKLDDGIYLQTITADAAGRLVLPDGSTIDSPLENLALYQALLAAIPETFDPTTTTLVSVRYQDLRFQVPSNQLLDLAASLLAAAADKTGTLSVDYVMSVSTFLGVADNLSAVVDSYTYAGASSTYNIEVPLLVETSPGVYQPAMVNLVTGAYALISDPSVTGTTETVVFSTLPSSVDESGDNLPDPTMDTTDGVTAFTQTADDALQVLEFVHDNPVPE